MNLDDERNRQAMELFGSPFDQLSPWGKANVYSSLGLDENVKFAEIADKTEAVMLRRELAETKQRLASVLAENEDLWRENEELRLMYESNSDRRT